MDMSSLGNVYPPIKDAWKWWKRPKLKIEFDPDNDVKIYRFVDTGIVRKFGCVRVKNIGKSVARRCIGVLEVLKAPEIAVNLEKEHILHWADVPYSFRTVEPEPVDIDKFWRLDVVFSQPKHEYNLKTETPLMKKAERASEIRLRLTDSAGTVNDYSPNISGNIISKAISTTLNTERALQQILDAPSEGAWIAIPIALSNPRDANQSYLSLGEYLVRLSVTCVNGDGDKRCFQITSPKNWFNLNMKILDCPEKKDCENCPHVT